MSFKRKVVLAVVVGLMCVLATSWIDFVAQPNMMTELAISQFDSNVDTAAELRVVDHIFAWLPVGMAGAYCAFIVVLFFKEAQESLG